MWAPGSMLPVPTGHSGEFVANLIPPFMGSIQRSLHVKIQQWKEQREFPSHPVLKNLFSNAGDSGLIPGWGPKIPHAEGQLSPCIDY